MQKVMLEAFEGVAFIDCSVDKVNVAKRFYDELYRSIPTDQSLQYKFLQHVPRVISSKHNEFLCTAISKNEIYNAICEMKNGKTPGPDSITVV